MTTAVPNAASRPAAAAAAAMHHVSVHAFGGLAMGNENRTTALTFLGWVALTFGIAIFAVEFGWSEHTLSDFQNALKEGFLFFLFAAFLFVQVRFVERIRKLEKENAALRAAHGELGSTQGKAPP
jgi:hypothetical protein